MATAPTSPNRPRRGILFAGMTAIVVAAVAGGTLVVTRDIDEDAIVEDARELATDPSIDASEAYSFAAATVSAQQAASVVFDMKVDSPDGPIAASASFDRASGRLAMDLDMSEVVAEGDFFDVGDSISFIVDEPSQTAFVSASFLGAMFGATEGWISLTGDEFSMDDDSLGDLFSNPLSIADVFGDVEPLDLGDETIDGEVLRHFQVTLDDAAIAELSDDTFVAPDPSPAGVEVTYDVWVDESSQIRRILFDASTDGEVASVDMWITISADPVDIALPAPDEIVSIDEVFGGAFEDFEVEANVTLEDD